MENERLITLEEVAERMQVSVPTVRRWIKARKLPATKPSGVYRVRTRDLEEFIETGKATAPSASGRPEGQTVTVGSERTVLWRVEELLINAMRRARQGEDEHKIAREVAQDIEELRAS